MIWFIACVLMISGACAMDQKAQDTMRTLELYHGHDPFESVLITTTDAILAQAEYLVNRDMCVVQERLSAHMPHHRLDSCEIPSRVSLVGCTELFKRLAAPSVQKKHKKVYPIDLLHEAMDAYDYFGINNAKARKILLKDIYRHIKTLHTDHARYAVAVDFLKPFCEYHSDEIFIDALYNAMYSSNNWNDMLVKRTDILAQKNLSLNDVHEQLRLGVSEWAAKDEYYKMYDILMRRLKRKSVEKFCRDQDAQDLFSIQSIHDVHLCTQFTDLFVCEDRVMINAEALHIFRDARHLHIPLLCALTRGALDVHKFFLKKLLPADFLNATSVYFYDCPFLNVWCKSATGLQGRIELYDCPATSYRKTYKEQYKDFSLDTTNYSVDMTHDVVHTRNLQMQHINTKGGVIAACI